MIKNSAIYVFGLLISKGIFYLLTPLYTMYLTPTEYGFISLFNTIVNLLSILFVFGMNSALTRYFVDQDDVIGKKELVSTVLTFLVFLSVLLTTIMVLLKDFIQNTFFQFSDSSQVFYMLIILSATSIFQLIPLTILRMEEKALKFVIFSVSESIFIISFSFLALSFLKGNSIDAIIALVVARLVMVIFYLVYVLRYLDYKILIFNSKLMKNLLLYAIPLIPHSLALWINNLGDRIILEKNLGLSEVGIYSLGAQFSSLLMLVITSFSQAFTPAYFKKLKSNSMDQKEFDNIFLISLGFISISAIVVFEATPYIIDLITNESFSYNYNFVGILLFSTVFQLFYIFGFAPLSYYKKNVDITKVTFLAAIINLGGNLLLVPILGILGSAIANVLSYLIRFLLVYYLSNKLTKGIYKWPTVSSIYITSLLLISLLHISNSHFINWGLSLLSILIISIIITRKTKINFLSVIFKRFI
jgi:O-antigen/teichoic acid export membrane protein